MFAKSNVFADHLLIKPVLANKDIDLDYVSA